MLSCSRKKADSSSPATISMCRPAACTASRTAPTSPRRCCCSAPPVHPREAYFEGLLELAEGKQMSEQELSAFFVEHDNLYVE
jgi:hypothetical protein